MQCLKIQIVGFKEAKERLYEICVEEGVKVSRLLEDIRKILDISLDHDEIMIVCNDRQIYLEEHVPADCKILTLFPLALGG